MKKITETWTIIALILHFQGKGLTYGTTQQDARETISKCVCGQPTPEDFKEHHVHHSIVDKFDYERARQHLNESLPETLYSSPNPGLPKISAGQSFFGGNDERILQGEPEQYRPWLALIIFDENKHFSSNQRCGGTLINHWYVMTASHCVCPTKDKDRLEKKRCHETKERIPITEFPLAIYMCFGLVRDGHCRREIEAGISYMGAEVVVQKGRLQKNNPVHYDIALIKTNRRVEFTRNIYPVCLPQALNFQRYDKQTAFISGYGLKYLRRKDIDSDPMCRTDQKLPRPFHFCGDSGCHATEPPHTSPFEHSVCSWIIYRKFDEIDQENTDVIRVHIPKIDKAFSCFPNKSDFGWCYINDTVSHHAFHNMPRWGQCQKICADDFNKRDDEEEEYGRASWALISLLSYKDCYGYFDHTGEKQSIDEVQFNPEMELCAAKVYDPKVQDVSLHDFTMSDKNVSAKIQFRRQLQKLPNYIGGVDACQGDSGGPLWRWQIDNTSGEKRAVQIGIIARGDQCANINRPGIYTKIHYFSSWIKAMTSDGECDEFI